MSKKEDTRKQVSEFYERGLIRAGGCCGGSGLVENLAKYDPDSLAQVPVDAQATSFACGDPLAFSGVEPGQTVLDLGCGAGLDLLIAADKVGPKGRVIGVDMTEAMLSVARGNVSRAGLDIVELLAGIIEELPVDDSSVDWVISNCVLNLSPDKASVFAEIVRVLRPGGQISISDMVAENLPDWVRSSADLYGACVAGAVSEKVYLEGLGRAGLEDVRVAERRVFGQEELALLMGGEEGGCCCGAAGGSLSDDQIQELSGKVASIQVRGHKVSTGTDHG